MFKRKLAIQNLGLNCNYSPYVNSQLHSRNNLKHLRLSFFRLRFFCIAFLIFYENKPSTYQYQLATRITALPHLTYQPCGLQGVLLSYDMGYLILRRVSRLDAFSVYLVRTSLPCYAVGTTTGAQQVRSSRSSRTRDKASQISYAHDGQGPNCLTTF